MDILEKFLKLATPVVALLVGYFTIVSKLQVRNLEKQNENLKEQLEDEIQDRKEAVKRCEELIKEKVSEKVCQANHRWNGYNRRDKE